MLCPSGNSKSSNVNKYKFLNDMNQVLGSFEIRFSNCLKFILLDTVAQSKFCVGYLF